PESFQLTATGDLVEPLLPCHRCNPSEGRVVIDSLVTRALLADPADQYEDGPDRGVLLTLGQLKAFRQPVPGSLSQGKPQTVPLLADAEAHVVDTIALCQVADSLVL